MLPKKGIMKINKAIICLLLFVINTTLFGSIDKKTGEIRARPSQKSIESSVDKKEMAKLLTLYENNNLDKKQLVSLKKRTLLLGGRAVPILIDVMKNSKFAEKNRWMATFLLGKIMGEKAAPFIAKFMEHPNWIMRMASLKTLLALKQDRYGAQYAGLLKDKSFIVRIQALENIRKLNLSNHSAEVWAMLYDKNNYYAAKDSKLSKRTNIIKEAIKVVGDLKFGKARDPLLKMSANKKYSDIFGEIDYSLEQITGKKSPAGNVDAKRVFWKNFSLGSKVII